MPARLRCLILGLALLGLAFTRTVAAATAPVPCTDPTIRMVVPPGPQWENAVEDLSAHLRTLSDLDRCARILVTPQGTGVALEITTGDGRKASRRANSVQDLLRVTEAVLVLPPPPVATEPKLSPLEYPPTSPNASERSRQPLPGATHVELGVGGAFRLGGSPTYGGAGLAGFAEFDLEHWLIAVSARLDFIDGYLVQATPSDFYMQSTAVGVTVGRRLEISHANLDALAGPNLVLESQDGDDGNTELHGAAADFRLGLVVRLSGPRSSSLRAFVAADLEGSPGRVHTQKFVSRSLPPLPWWSSGVSVGVVWGAR